MPIEHPCCRRWSWPVVRNRESSSVICFLKQPSESATLTKPDIRMCITIYPSVFVFLTAGWLDYCIGNYLRQTKWPVFILFMWLSDVYCKNMPEFLRNLFFIYIFVLLSVERRAAFAAKWTWEFTVSGRFTVPRPQGRGVFKSNDLNGRGLCVIAYGFLTTYFA